ACMEKILQIESDMGRVRTTRNAARVIDIDILFFDDLISREPRLQIPHPRIEMRRFTLIPLVEIAPMLKHPVSGKTMQELLEACTDPLPVQKI
ncbi:MAG TPA: 2-amino-4-hydroxy-6-hydroxymethyldihydropteridine diphosphokinase, partial [Ferruginibacter sp.]|nr:2-amino-4-hydroxy-6-hydroxymethyldihydropteridine diphosphokinase [Ferruginibacter sp.]